jgi:sulfide:quinone oxidoreductase
MARTLILGGGFGGLTAANTLRGLLPATHDILVIDQTDRFFVGAGKTWIMLGERTFEQISQARAALLAPGVAFRQATVTDIDLTGRRVVLGDQSSLGWDSLVIALGADVHLGAVPGLAEAAHTFYTVGGAERLKSALEQFAGGDVVLLTPRLPFKCPPAPYEAAMLLHDAFAKRGLAGKTRIAMYTAEGAPMGTAGPEMGQFIKAELAARDIAYFPSRTTTRVDGEQRRVVFEDGTEASYDLLIAVPPHEAPAVVRDAGLTNPSGWIPVDPLRLRVTQPAGATDVYAVGDVTVVPLPGRFKPDVGLSLPKAGVFAAAQGRVVAHQIAAQVLGQPAGQTFDGAGYCFLETGAGRAVRAEGNFFALPHPVMQKRTPDEAQWRDKAAWIEGLLQPKR